MAMEWEKVLRAFDKPGLQRAHRAIGLEPGDARRAELERRLVRALVDDHTKRSVLSELTNEKLRRLGARLGVVLGSARTKAEMVQRFLEEDTRAEERRRAAEEPPRPIDARRHDVSGRSPDRPSLDLVPTQPIGDDTALFDELARHLSRPTLHRMVFVSYVCNPRTLAHLLDSRLDDFIEALSRGRGGEPRPGAEPRLTLVLDREKHQLGSPSGRKLVAMAQERPDLVELRLGPMDRTLHAKIYLFEETRDGVPWVSGYIGSSNLTGTGLGAFASSANIEANVRIAGPLTVEGGPTALLQRWVEQLLRATHPLTEADLQAFDADPDVRRKVRYKRHFDTAHELRLKHLAEELCRRGRYTWPLCDVTQLHRPPEHQLAPVVRSARAGRVGFLLLDEVGLGKTIEAGLILSRELRRRRDRPDASPPRALLLAPNALHEQWREELETKFHLRAEVFTSGHAEARARELGLDPGAYWEECGAQVLITSPALIRNQWYRAQGFDVLLVDEFHRARGKVTHEALDKVSRSCDLVLLASGTPVQNRLEELRNELHLIEPGLELSGDDAFRRLFGDGATPEDQAALRDTLRPIASRAFRRPLLGFGEGRIPPRQVQNIAYALSAAASQTYRALRDLRDEYARARSGRVGFAFLTLEQTFLSSPHAFLQLAAHIAGDRWAPPELDGEAAAALTSRDDSYAFLRESPSYRPRLRALSAGLRAEAEAPDHLSAKERVFLELLQGLPDRRVLVFTRFLATQQRLLAVLTRAGLGDRVRLLNGHTPRHERTAQLGWFTSHPQPSRPGTPSSLLVCTDVAAEGLNLQEGCSVLVNYDLPWNPQRIEQRIGRLQRWGQREAVQVFNLQARDPAAPDGWTMDTRVLEVCEQKFGLASESVGASEALLGLEPLTVDEALATGELDVPERSGPNAAAAQALDALFPGEDDTEHAEAVATGRRLFDAYASHADAFWERVTNQHGGVARAQNAFFDRLQHALLQGQVALLRDVGMPLERARHLSALVGLRVILESVELEAPGNPIEDAHPDLWHIDDELVRVWGLRPAEAPFDASEWLMKGGLAEVLPEEAAPLVDAATLDFLARHKRALEDDVADGVPLADLLADDPPPALRAHLEQAQAAAERLAEERAGELVSEWEADRAARRARFERLLAHAHERRLPKRALNRIEALLTDEAPLVIETEVRLTQLALVLE